MPGKRLDVPTYSYYAILQYGKIIFVAGLKGDKFNGYVGILSTFGLFVRYVKFEFGIKKADKYINYR